MNEALPALLVIDIQESFRVAPRWQGRNNPAFEDNVARLIAAFRERKLPVIFVLHSEPGSHDSFDPAQGYVRLQDFLERHEGEALLTKTTRGVFASTDLGAHLQALGVGRLVISGIQTEQCCETTAREGGDRGYAVDFVTEATRTFPIAHWAAGPTLEPDAIVERTEYALAGRFATIRTVDEVIATLPRGVVA
ncbi:nicotinamidase-related amidase [Deinobacterium chartae]|uniref:Nicotinamidase-related amidase n=1 Tax=Deinobacterium chartae TaxID=521158 RepID=A0A841I470_9DEIO|nr:isochorismatase family protein [Deinobacterium chartae]MBB6099834.1 nicotinamidase-related amidase [Deinobacterium chartae]